MGDLEKEIAQLRSIGASDVEVNAYIAEHKTLRAPSIKVSGESTGAGPFDIAQRREAAAETPKQFGVGILRSALGGVTLGSGDELEASARAIGGANVNSALNKVRAEKDTFRTRHPAVSRVAEGVGGIVPAAATAMFPPTAALGPIAGGAMFGALYGAGESEGIDDLPKSATTGALVGAGTGGLMRAAAGGGRMAYDVARFGARSEPAQAIAGSRAVRAIKAVPGAPGSPPPSAGGGVPPIASSRVLSALGPRNPSQRGESLILKRLGSDKVTLSDLEAAAAGTQKPVSIMDLAGDNTRGVARGARSVPSEAKESIPKAIYERAEGQGKRIRGDLESASGTPPADFGKTEDLIATRRANAQPKYQKAYESPDVKDAAINETFQLPAFQQAYKRAQRIAKTEGVDLPPLSAKGGVPVKTIDYIKRGMDDVIDGQMRSGGMGPTEARALRKRLDDALFAADASSPAYAEARGQFSSDSKAIDALELGRQFSKTDDREVGRVVASLSPGDKELYVQGAMDDLTQAIRSRGDSQDAIALVFGSEEKRDALKALLGKDGYESFAKHMGVEKQMLHTKRMVLGGSNTADKLAEQLDVDNTGIANAVASGVTGSPLLAARQALANSALMQRLRGLTEETANEIAPLLTAGMNGDRNALTAALVRLREAEQREGVRRVIRNTATRPFTGGAGGAAGGFVSGNP